jgi:hypothetical protein
MTEKDQANKDIETFEFERDFPKEYGLLRALMEKTVGSTRLTDDQTFRRDLGEIVHLYGRDHPKVHYRKAVDELADDLTDLMGMLGAVLDAIGELDDVYNQRIVEVMAQNPMFEEPNYSLGHVLRDLLKAERALSYYYIALKFSVVSEPISEGRSRPRLLHFVPTVQLMDLWERYTQKKIVAPKGVAKGKSGIEEAEQPSTEFVRLGLKMIDPNSTIANTMTLMKQALTEKRICGFETYAECLALPKWEPMFKAIEQLLEKKAKKSAANNG